MAAKGIAHPSIDERRARGAEARRSTAPSSHMKWRAAADRPDPVALLEEQNTTREPDLVPVRHGRMMVSPFTFYRGAAKIMAADLKDTPTAGLDAQYPLPPSDTTSHSDRRALRRANHERAARLANACPGRSPNNGEQSAFCQSPVRPIVGGANAASITQMR